MAFRESISGHPHFEADIVGVLASSRPILWVSWLSSWLSSDFGGGDLCGRWRVLGEDFGAGHVLGFVGEFIVGRFLIDENLVIENQTPRFPEQADRHEVLPIGLDPVEQMAAALVAEAALGPLGGSENSNRFLSFQGHIGSAIERKKRAARPLAAHAAMAGAYTLADIAGDNAHASTKTISNFFDDI